MKARENPFRTDRVLQVRYQLGGTTWAGLCARIETLGYRAAIIGPHGSGKTTLLEDLEPRLGERGFRIHFLRLNEEQRTFAPVVLKSLCARLTRRDIILLDGAEQLRPLAWRWFRWQTRRAGGLIITTHRAGRLPTLWECRTSPDLLAGIAAELLEVERATLDERVRILFAKHRGNLREALREWYDVAAAQDPTG